MAGSLSARDVVEYLQSVQIWTDPREFQVQRAPGRHETFVVSNFEGARVWYVKQFPCSDQGRELFERECWAASSVAIPSLKPAVVDVPARVIVYPVGGTSLWDLLSSDRTVHESVAAATRHAVDEIHGVPAKLGVSLPAIVSRLQEGRSGAELSLGEQRILSILLGSAVARGAAIDCATSWCGSGTVHGDLKLNHLLVDGSSQVSVIDWELAGPGPRNWDRASLIASLLIQPMLGLSRWSGARAALVRSLVGEGESNPEDMAPQVALCLWQSATEWASGNDHFWDKLASLVQLGLNLVEDRSALQRLTASLGGG